MGLETDAATAHAYQATYGSNSTFPNFRWIEQHYEYVGQRKGTASGDPRNDVAHLVHHRPAIPNRVRPGYIK